MPTYTSRMAKLRLFATARIAAGTGRDEVEGGTVGEVLQAASTKYGPAFVEVVPHCQVWVNGEAASPDTVVDATDEVALLPPVSGG